MTKFSGIGALKAFGWCVGLVALVLATACGGSSGGRIAFVTTVGGDPEIAVLDVKTGETTIVTENRSEDLSPRWSPDGKTVAYVSDESGEMDINLVDGKDHVITRLTHSGTEDQLPHWSPDGEKIAFMAESGGQSELYLTPLEGGAATRVSIDTSQGVNASVLGGWSPDGEWLVSYREGSTEERGLWLRNPSGVNKIRLTTGMDREPAWSPDGDRIAFVRTQEDNDDIFVLRFLGGGRVSNDFEVIRLTQQESNEGSPNWSPDALNLAFVSYRDGDGEIYSMSADGSKQRQLTNNAADDLTPDWSSDGRRIAFVSHVYGQSEIFIMNADGSDQQRLTNNSAEDHSPDW